MAGGPRSRRGRAPLGYRPDAFAGRFPEGRFGALRIRYAVEPEPLGTAGALRFAAAAVAPGERLIVCNGDVLTDLDLSRLVELHGARVDRSVLLDGARAGMAGEVLDSILGPGAAVGENASVSQLSIVGAMGRVANGMRLSGARLN